MENLNKKLRDACENVYPGWWPILEKYVPQILDIDPDSEIWVKEKYGALRVHAVSETHNWTDFTEIELAAEAESKSVCEICGEPGELRSKQRWVQTLCDRCAAMTPDERRRVGYEISEKMIHELKQKYPDEEGQSDKQDGRGIKGELDRNE